MAQTLTIVGKATIPLEDDPALAAPIDLGLTMQFGQGGTIELSYDASVTDQAVPLGTLATAGAKFLLIKSPIGGCLVKLNDASSGIPVPPGAGYIIIGNPVQGWLTGLKVSTTGAAKVRVTALA